MKLLPFFLNVFPLPFASTTSTENTYPLLKSRVEFVVGVCRRSLVRRAQHLHWFVGTSYRACTAFTRSLRFPHQNDCELWSHGVSRHLFFWFAKITFIPTSTYNRRHQATGYDQGTSRVSHGPWIGYSLACCACSARLRIWWPFLKNKQG